MNFTKYTTQELEFITSNIELLKNELKKRQIKESDSFPFNVGDVVHAKNDDDNFFIKIKEIDKIDNYIVIDEIVIRDGGLFDAYVDEWFDTDDVEWQEYVKIEDSKIFEKFLKIIDKYNNDVQQLNDDTYLKLKNEIAIYDLK